MNALPVSKPHPIRILVVDDHPLVRDGIRLRLQCHTNIDVVAEASDVDAAERAVMQVRPDLVISDIRMPGRSGIELMLSLAELRPESQVILLSMLKDVAFIQRALALGARGYVLKDAHADELLQAIHVVHDGGCFISPSLGIPALSDAVDRQPPTPLTPREVDVLRQVAQGLSSKEIALALGMSVRTVETHRLHLRRKLRLHSAKTLAQYAEHISDPAR